MEVKKTLPPLDAEAAELDRELAGIDTPATGAPGSAPATPAESDQAGAEAGAPAEIPLDQEVAGCVVLIGTIYGELGMPSVAKVLDDERAMRIGAKVAPVLVKYGLDKYIRGFAWRVELEAAMIVVPTIAAVRAAMRVDLAGLREPARPAAPLGDPPAPSPSSPPVEMLKPIDQPPL